MLAPGRQPHTREAAGRHRRATAEHVDPTLTEPRRRRSSRRHAASVTPRDGHPNGRRSPCRSDYPRVPAKPSLLDKPLRACSLRAAHAARDLIASRERSPVAPASVQGQRRRRRYRVPCSAVVRQQDARLACRLLLVVRGSTEPRVEPSAETAGFVESSSLDLLSRCTRQADVAGAASGDGRSVRRRLAS
jgi:hypothetical protein